MPRCRHRYLDDGECWCIHCRDNNHNDSVSSAKRRRRRKVRSR